MLNWRFIEFESDCPLFNLAIDEAILCAHKRGAPVLRIWRNTKKVVIIGRFQCPEYEASVELCRRFGISIIRRFTGGGAVYQDEGSVNLSVAVPVDSPFFYGLGDNLYKLLGMIISSFLLEYGIDSTLKGNSVFVGEKKIAGMAGYVGRDIVFHHASLIVSTDPKFIERILKGREYDSCRCVKSNRQPTTSLSLELKREIKYDELKERLKEIPPQLFEISLVSSPLTAEEIEIAEKIYREKYLHRDYSIFVS